jgi:hypothetical protein
VVAVLQVILAEAQIAAHVAEQEAATAEGLAALAARTVHTAQGDY